MNSYEKILYCYDPVLIYRNITRGQLLHIYHNYMQQYFENNIKTGRLYFNEVTKLYLFDINFSETKLLYPLFVISEEFGIY